MKVFNDTTALAGATLTADQIVKVKSVGEYRVQDAGTGITLANGKIAVPQASGTAISVRQFGAVGDGVADDTAAIQAALDSGAAEVFLPAGTYKTTSSINIDGYISVKGEGIRKTYIKPDVSVLEAVQVGLNTAVTGTIRDISIDRTTYSGATENIGWALYHFFEASFYDVESRWSKYNFEFKSGNGQFVAYTTFNNLVAIGGFYNLYWNPTGTGYVNQNIFYGGRLFTGPNTDTQVHFDGGSNNNFMNVCAEGSATQSFYIGGSGNTVFAPRTEGTWSANDIVLTATSVRTMVFAYDFYANITDNGSGNSYFTLNDGSKLSTIQSSKTTLALEYDNAGDGNVLDLDSTRNNTTAYLIRGYGNTNLNYSVTTNGIVNTATSLQVENNLFSQPPLRIGGTNGLFMWTDEAKDTLYMKHGATPSSGTDGFPVMRGQTSVAAGLGNAANIVNTLDKYAGKMVFDTGLNKPLWATGSATTSTWVDATGAVAYTPV